MTAIDTARAVLAAASLIDPTMPKPDANALRMWAELLGDVDPDRAVRAVKGHYSDEHRRVMPSDVLKRCKAEQATVTRLSLDYNRVPDADPDDVPAYLEALRSGKLVDRSPRPDAPARPIEALVAAAANRHRVPGGAS